MNKGNRCADASDSTHKQAPSNVEGVFLAGNGWSTIGVIAPLEEDLGRPVLTANQASFWYALRQAGVGAQALQPVACPRRLWPGVQKKPGTRKEIKQWWLKGWFADVDFRTGRAAGTRLARHSPLTEHVRSFAGENLSRSTALFLASGPAACEQSRLPPSWLKRSQRMRVLCPRFGGQA